MVTFGSHRCHHLRVVTSSLTDATGNRCHQPDCSPGNNNHINYLQFITSLCTVNFYIVCVLCYSVHLAHVISPRLLHTKSPSRTTRVHLSMPQNGHLPRGSVFLSHLVFFLHIPTGHLPPTDRVRLPRTYSTLFSTPKTTAYREGQAFPKDHRRTV